MTKQSAFSLSTLDSTPLPVVPYHLLPWLRKDRREAVEGCYVKDSTGKVEHDGSGLQKAEGDLRRLERELSEATGHRAAILAIQHQQAAATVEFYQGKIYLLDKVIATTEARGI